jgi:uncharacterized membrane protein YgcG
MRWFYLAGLWSLGSVAWAQVGGPDAPYVALAKGTMFITPTAEKLIDRAAIEQAAEAMRPMTLKVLVVPSLGSQWVKNGAEQRGSYAKYAFEKKLSLSNAVFIVVTSKGITGYSDKVDLKTLSKLDNDALKLMDRKDFTPMITSLASSIAAAAQKSGTAQASPAGTAQDAGGSRAATILTVGGILAVGAVVGVGFLGMRARRNWQKIHDAKQAMQVEKNKATEAIDYLDSYADLIPDEENRQAIRLYRDRAYATYEDANQRATTAQKVADFAPITQMYRSAAEDAALGRPHIEAATNGTKIAYSIPPKLDPSATAAPIYAPFEGVCFFTGKPDPNLTPVTINLDGQRRTVMASQEALAEMRHHGEPQMRGTYDQGRFVPWYMNRGYDPYTMYGSQNFMWQTLAMSSMINLFNPFWAAPMLMGGYFSPIGSMYHDPSWGSSNNFGNDLGGGDSQMGDFNASGDFGGSMDFGSSDSGGGGDFGGGDFGGGGGDF